MWTPSDRCVIPGSDPPTRNSPSMLSLLVVVLAGIGVAGVVLQVGLLLVVSSAAGTKAFLPFTGALLINVLGFVLYWRHHSRCHPWSGLFLFVVSFMLTGVAMAYAIVAGLMIAAKEVEHKLDDAAAQAEHNTPVAAPPPEQLVTA